MPRTVAASTRRATNVTLPEQLIEDARTLGVNLSQACERGVLASVAEARRQRWLHENKDAIGAWNDHVEQNGLPLDRFRQF